MSTIKYKVTKDTNLETLETFEKARQSFFERQSVSHDQAVISAFCDCCDAQASNTRQALIFAGWHLGAREQFCSECNF